MTATSDAPAQGSFAGLGLDPDLDTLTGHQAPACRCGTKLVLAAVTANEARFEHPGMPGRPAASTTGHDWTIGHPTRVHVTTDIRCALTRAVVAAHDTAAVPIAVVMAAGPRVVDVTSRPHLTLVTITTEAAHLMPRAPHATPTRLLVTDGLPAEHDQHAAARVGAGLVVSVRSPSYAALVANPIGGHQ